MNLCESILVESTCKQDKKKKSKSLNQFLLNLAVERIVHGVRFNWQFFMIEAVFQKAVMINDAVSVKKEQN